MMGKIYIRISKSMSVFLMNISENRLKIQSVIRANKGQADIKSAKIQKI